VTQERPHIIREGVLLAPFTTIGLGGSARYFAECRTDEDITASLDFAGSHDLRVQVLGGGSNTVFSDEGFDGIVIHVASRGITFEVDGLHTIVTTAAGEPWDQFVNAVVAKGLAGVECLAGIPSTVGATPIQNVGAYGQDVSEVIVDVTVLDRQSRKRITLNAVDCRFAYRQSRFKSGDANRYLVTQVRFRLMTDGVAQMRYPDLRKFFEQSGGDAWRAPGAPGLTAVRDAVITIRKTKSMVLDPADLDTKSVGSFFMNPVVTPSEFEQLQHHYRKSGRNDPVPSFKVGDGVKIPAAWLVEHSGFHRGYRLGNVGISRNHALALVNRGGTAAELLTLARKIQEKVQASFGIMLEPEPVIVSPT
jgi:UDP-N-acetylmuramate dehydrogenase